MKVNIENIKNTIKKQMDTIKGSTDTFFTAGQVGYNKPYTSNSQRRQNVTISDNFPID